MIALAVQVQNPPRRPSRRDFVYGRRVLDAHATKIGRYLVLAGGPARFVAYDPELGRKVDLEVGIDPQMRPRAQRLAKLVHPNVVRLHDVGIHDDLLYLAFDHLEGESLRAWCERERPSWRAVLEAFIDGGEGLAAAHRAGLRHGAVGLDAFVRSDDERVRVTDFVRTGAQQSDPSDEQIDSRAFVAALHEALGGSTLEDRGVPRRLRRFVLDAIEAPDAIPIATFVARLRRQRPRARRWAWSVAAAALVAAGFVAHGEEARHDIASSTYCGAFSARLDALWNDDVRGERGRAVGGLEAEFAAAAWERAATAIDAYADELARAQARDCARREAGEAVPEAVSLCLHRRFESLSAFLRALEDPNPAIMANLSDSIAGLGTPQECEAIEHEGPQLPGIEMAVLLELEAKLSDAETLSGLGRSAEAVVAAKKAMSLAESLNARWYVARAEFVAAHAQWELDDDDAIDSFHRAFASALASEHDDVMCKSATSLAGLLSEQGRSDEARQWLDHAAAAQERTGDPAALARIEVTLGQIDFFDGDYAKAKISLEHALARVADDTDPEVRFLAEQLHAATLAKLGDARSAIVALEGTVARAEAFYGPRHPTLVAPLISLAGSLYTDGRIADAQAAIERAVVLSEEAFGPDHWGSMSARIEQIAMLDASGDSDAAVAIAEDLLATAKRTLGSKDIRYPGVLDAVARVYFPAGRRVEAVELLREAVRLHEAAAGERHPSTLIFMGNLAAALLFSGRAAEAEAAARIVLARNEDTIGPDHPSLVAALLGLAQAIRDQGRFEESAPFYQRALEIAERHDVRGQRLGAVQFNLAVALWEGSVDKARAIELARASLRSYAAAEREGWNMSPEINEARAWLNEREQNQRTARSGT